MSNALTEQISRQIEAAVAEAYARGKADAKRELRSLLLAGDDEIAITSSERGGQSRDEFSDTEVSVARRRAPKGLPKMLIDRVLVARPDGVLPQDIVEAASTDYERMIKLSSIRGELRNGQNARRYTERDGLWYKRD